MTLIIMGDIQSKAEKVLDELETKLSSQLAKGNTSKAGMKDEKFGTRTTESERNRWSQVNCPSLKTEACNSRPYGQW